MKRLLPLTLALPLVILALLLPDLPAERLAALEAYHALIDPEPAPADAALDGPACRTDGRGNTVLALNKVWLQTPDGAPRPDKLTRRSIVRGLREAASKRGMSLVILGEEQPADDEAVTASFLVHMAPGELMVDYVVEGRDHPPMRASVEWTPPSGMSLLPPLLAIALAILLRKPLPSLFLGVLAGAWLLRTSTSDPVTAVPLAFKDYAVDFLWPEVINPERYMIVLFVVFMLAMVGVITRNGGLRGLMDRIARVANSASRTQLATYLMGLVVFFDDYANTILVGSTMRPLSDRWKVSREKLAYLIDSTAAPVAGLAVLSTWIAFEVSTFSAQLPAAGLTAADGYAVFLQTLPYRFYCILTLVFVGLIASTGRDFGPMLRAERRARTTGALVRPDGKPLVSEGALSLTPAENATPDAWMALLPILTFVGVTLFEIARVGGAFSMAASKLFTLEGLTTVLYDGSGSRPLMVGSLTGLVLAVGLSVMRSVPLRTILGAAASVLLSMGVAILILYHAWMIGAVCNSLGTASYLTALVGENLDPRLLPALLFVMSGVIAFSTGSSWSTMSILLPLVVALSYGLGLDAGLADTASASGLILMVMSIGAVLEGAIFGDHCSPISDTTVLSSIAAASDHIDHVRTQIPYALVTMGVAMAAGYLPCTYLGISPWTGMACGALALVAIVLVVGRACVPRASGS